MLTPSNTQLPPPSNWEDFEHLCWLLWRAEWDDKSTQKHGRRGQSQCGVDVFGQPLKGNWSGVQCKGKDNYSAKRVTVAELECEVEKAKGFNPPLSEFILATTAPRDAKIQAAARQLTEAHQKKELFGVTVYSWEDICGLLELHEDVFARVYPGSPVTKQTQHYDGSSLTTILKGHHTTISNQLSQHTQQVQATLLCSLFKQGQDLEELTIPDVSQEQMTEIISVLNGKKQGQNRQRRTGKRSSVKVLTPERTHVLGLLAVSRFPFSAAALNSIFPKINWKTHLSYLRRHELVDLDDGYYSVPNSIRGSLIKDEKVEFPYLEEWIAALDPLRGHPDTSLFLAIYQIAVGRLQDSIDTLVDAALGLLPGRWNDTFLSILLQMDERDLKQVLTNPQQVSYLNSVALCLYRAKRYQEAIEWFTRLRKLSTRLRNNWGIGQSYHNCGIVYIEVRNLEKAEECFRNAVKHSRKTRDRFLLGRSLYELAIVIANTSEEEARKHLEESERIKKKVKDKAGLVGINHGYATLALQNGDYRQAIKWFKKAETAAKNVHHYHAEALERYNVGHCYLDLDEYQEALIHLRHARKLAEKDELADVIQLSLGGEAMALTSLHRYKQAEKVFRELHVLHKNAGDVVNTAISLHDIGATLLGQEKYDEARKSLRRATQYARQNEVFDWLYQSQTDIGKSYVLEGRSDKAISWLVQMAANEDGRKLKEVAAKLCIDAVEYSILHGVTNSATSKAISQCQIMSRSKRISEPLRAELLSTLHLSYWHNQDYKAGIKALEDLLAFAKETGEKQLACRAQDQIGVCLQELGRVKEAISAHRAALKIARRQADPDIVETSLNNLGEALRKTGKHAEAVQLLEEAETSARERNDVEAAISYAHNRALAIEHQREFEAAETLFKACRDEARRHKLWREYVRALHALANIAWHEGKPSLALSRYDTALNAAGKYGSDSRHEICLNYANALRWKEQPQRALEVLKSAEAEFERIPDAHLYHSQLANLYDDLGKNKAAKRQWGLSYESAVRVGDDYAIALSSGALAEALNSIGDLRKADAHYETALKHEDDDTLRIQLLLERMGILLQLKSERKAESVFEEICRLAKKDKFQDEYIDALLMLGDYNWTEGKSPADGLKAYLTAMAAYGSNNIERYIQLGAMTTMRLAHIKGRNKAATVRQLEKSTLQWLEQEQGIGEAEESRKYLLWPFVAALRLIKAGTEKHMPEEEFAIIMEEEFERAIA